MQEIRNEIRKSEIMELYNINLKKLKVSKMFSPLWGCVAPKVIYFFRIIL